MADEHYVMVHDASIGSEPIKVKARNGSNLSTCTIKIGRDDVFVPQLGLCKVVAAKGGRPAAREIGRTMLWVDSDHWKGGLLCMESLVLWIDPP